MHSPRLVPPGYADYAAAARLNVSLPPDPVTVSCDSTRTIQVLTNLLSNALKYSPPETMVDVTVAAADGHGVVTVT